MMETLEEIALRLGFIRLLDQLDDLAAAAPEQASDLTTRLTSLGGGFQQSARSCVTTHGLLVAAWSTVAPRESVQILQRVLDHAARLTELVREAGVSGLSAVYSAQAQAAAAVSSARLRMPQLTASDLNSAMLGDAAGMLLDLTIVGGLPVADSVREQLQPGVIAAQQQVLADLQLILDGVIEDWDSALRTLISQLDVDFAGLGAVVGEIAPIGCGPVSALPAASPGQTDANLRALMNADLTSSDPEVREFAQFTQAALEQAALASGTSYLLIYDPRSPQQGGLAIGVGDLETASHVLLMAGGIGTGPDTIPGDIADAAAVLSVANEKDPGDSSAAIVYAGYDAPFGGSLSLNSVLEEEIPAMTSLVYATEQGRIMEQQLTAILNGLPAGANVTAVLHSFGTTVGAAAIKAGLPVDQIVFTGSPGVGFNTADQLPVDPAFQFVVANANDPVVHQNEVVQAAMGSVFPLLTVLKVPDVLGPNPADPKYGGQLIDQESGLPILQAHQTPAYMTPEGVENVAAILTEQYDDVEVVGEK